MFDFDVSKLLLVAVLALIVLGPEKLPKAARMAGVMLRRARTGWDSVRTEVEQELQLEELRTAATRARTEMQSLGDATDRQLRAARNATDTMVAEPVSVVEAANDDPAVPRPRRARPGCTPEDIDGIAERARLEMENIHRIADRQIAVARARADEARAAAAATAAPIDGVLSRSTGDDCTG